ncbi:MAG: biopolymer transporter ExbD [Gemmatimonadota bacterium]|nr:MAG: biopolymer transporter ExbD [Gemmatimonadota bacterium]
MKFTSKAKVTEKIPTASMADIAFLLLIFFMLSTVFKQYQGLPIQLPRAQKTQKIETKRNITHVWTTAQGRVAIDDMLVDIPSIRTIMYNKRVVNPKIIVSLKTDWRARYGVVADVMEELKRADALRVNFATERKR